MEDYKEYIDFASRVLRDSNDWMNFKKVMLRTIPPKMRKKFSTRHPITKKQTLNEFEKKIIDAYYRKTGIMLELGEKNE